MQQCSKCIESLKALTAFIRPLVHLSIVHFAIVLASGSVGAKVIRNCRGF